MKAVLALALGLLPYLVFSTELEPGPDGVVVKVLDQPLPKDKAKREEFLWDNFANKADEKKFNSYTTDNWKTNYNTFAKALTRRAGELRLDSASLTKALDLVLKDSNDKIAYLPIGAYQTTLNRDTVWIITVRWEYPAPNDVAKLGHIRMFAFDQKTLKRVAYNTCM